MRGHAAQPEIIQRKAAQPGQVVLPSYRWILLVWNPLTSLKQYAYNIFITLSNPLSAMQYVNYQ